MAIIEDIDVWRGEDIVLNLTHTPGKDITGWVVEFTCSKAFNSTVKQFAVTGSVTSGPNGKAKVIITSTQLNNDPGEYPYSIFKVNPGFHRFLRGGELRIHENTKFPV